MLDVLAASFSQLFTVEALTTLLILTALETVLGFDNLLYISLEAKKVGPANEPRVRRLGLILASVFRSVLLVVVLWLISLFSRPFFEFTSELFEIELSGHALIVILGGLFLIYTALKEIFHMIGDPDLEHGKGLGQRRFQTVGRAILLITLMNLVFSFDTVLSAVALTSNLIVMVLAIMASGILMIVMSDAVAAFLQRNRMYEVLGLFVLLLVGILLLSEGGHLAHLHFFGYEITPLSKATFYFVLAALVIVEVIQGRYQRRLLREQELKRATLKDEATRAALPGRKLSGGQRAKVLGPAS